MIHAPNTTVSPDQKVIGPADLVDLRVVGVGAIAAASTYATVRIEEAGLGIVNHPVTADVAHSFSNFDASALSSNDGHIVPGSVEGFQAAEYLTGFLAVASIVGTIGSLISNAGGWRNAAALVSSPFRRRANRPVVTVPRYP